MLSKIIHIPVVFGATLGILMSFVILIIILFVFKKRIHFKKWLKTMIAGYSFFLIYQLTFLLNFFYPKNILSLMKDFSLLLSSLLLFTGAYKFLKEENISDTDGN